MTPDTARTSPESTLHLPRTGVSSSRALQYGQGLALAPGVADSPDQYKDKLRQTVESLPPEMRSYLDGYAPRSLPVAADSETARFIRTAVFAVAPLNKHTADQTAASITHLTGWAYLSKGLPLKNRLLLSSEVVGRWQQETLAAKELSKGTLRNYRGHLARISHAMGVELDARFDPITRTVRTRPYTAVDIEQMLLWARTLSPEMNRRARALLCLGAGAGLSPQEILQVRACDVITAGGMWVKVGEPCARLTPVLDVWRPRLRALLGETHPAETLFPHAEGPPSSTFITSWLTQQPAKQRPNPTRLRTTWIVEMLRTEGADANTLAYSGIERGETLAGYLPLLGEVERTRHTALSRMTSVMNSTESGLSNAAEGNAAHSAREGRVRNHRGKPADAGENS